MATGASEAQDRYVLQKGDRISVSVLEDPLMDQTSLIRPDGRISLPIVGSVRAEGRSPEEILTDLANHKAANPDFNITNVHFFPLGGIKKTAEFTDEFGASHSVAATA